MDKIIQKTDLEPRFSVCVDAGGEDGSVIKSVWCSQLLLTVGDFFFSGQTIIFLIKEQMYWS